MPSEQTERYIPSYRTGGVFESDRVRILIGKLLRNNPVQRLWHPSATYANIACGRIPHPGFLNVDYSWHKGVLCWDITKGLPIKTASLDGLFCEHALEHFEWRTALDIVLREFRRVLKPGGTLRIVVPDADLAIDEYLAARNEGVTAKRWETITTRPDRLNLTPMARLNNHFRRIYEPYYQGHKFMYDFQTLEQFLELSGFTDIRRTDFLKGRDPHLLVDYEKRRSESLYVEASSCAV